MFTSYGHWQVFIYRTGILSFYMASLSYTAAVHFSALLDNKFANKNSFWSFFQHTMHFSLSSLDVSKEIEWAWQRKSVEHNMAISVSTVVCGFMNLSLTDQTRHVSLIKGFKVKPEYSTDFPKMGFSYSQNKHVIYVYAGEPSHIMPHQV